MCLGEGLGVSVQLKKFPNLFRGFGIFSDIVRVTLFFGTYCILALSSIILGVTDRQCGFLLKQTAWVYLNPFCPFYCAKTQLLHETHLADKMCICT